MNTRGIEEKLERIAQETSWISLILACMCLMQCARSCDSPKGGADKEQREPEVKGT